MHRLPCVLVSVTESNFVSRYGDDGFRRRVASRRAGPGKPRNYTHDACERVEYTYKINILSHAHTVPVYASGCDIYSVSKHYIALHVTIDAEYFVE